MGKAMVYGFQGEDPNNIDQYHIATSMKHFMGYGVPWTGKDRTPAYISPIDLREKHLDVREPISFLHNYERSTSLLSWRVCRLEP